MSKKFLNCDGNTAAATIAYALSEVAAIYPITPSSTMGELADDWSARGRKNLFGHEVKVVEMQSEAGAAGAVHGSLSCGALTTTFTASQGLLLMIPNMFKMAGEMLPAVFHVTARSLACQSLSIFGDHSDVMAVRGTGFGLLASASVQEAHDLALVAHLAALESKVPFLHFFDGFRTSHEVQKIEEIDHDTISSLLDLNLIRRFKQEALRPERPYLKVGAQNPDVYFQGRETVNQYYFDAPGIVKSCLERVGQATGRHYQLFDYVGSPTAERIIVAMGSACETIEETVNYLNAQGANLGAVKVRLFRPFSAADLTGVIPATVKKIAVLDRTKEPGSQGEPLYMDVVVALAGRGLKIIGGRYGLSSKEFTPRMVKAVYDHLDGACSHDFTVGIEDDVTHLSLPLGPEVPSEIPGVVRCKFWGYGSDGTVSANKNSIKIIGEGTDKYVQGYFEYDSKKSGGITISHLRFSDHPIQSQYFLTSCDFIALHKPSYIGRYDILAGIKEGGVFLINSPLSPEEVFASLTEDMQKTIRERKVKVYTINATRIASEVGLGNRINTVMMAAFFKISGVIPEAEAIVMIKKAIQKQFKDKGENVVKMNWESVDKSSDAVMEVPIPASGSFAPVPKLVPDDSSAFVRHIIEPIMRLKGDTIPVSRMPLQGGVPTSTARLEKRAIADEVANWIPEHCIQCGQCSMACPHATIRTKQIAPQVMAKAPATFRSLKSNTKNDKDLRYVVQIYPEDCVGCGVCVEVCPSKTKALEMIPIAQSRAAGENDNMGFFEDAPDNLTEGTLESTVKGSQLLSPYFEFSGACGGCGETPYIKLATQLFGDRMIVANATGCSSIYSGTFPTTPYCTNKQGQGPAWANSLFEDNAEYGFGFRLAVDANRAELKGAMEQLLELGIAPPLSEALQAMLAVWTHTDQAAKDAARRVVEALPAALAQASGEAAQLLRQLDDLKDYLVDKSIWILGGDGWAYDIGYGGLDHVLAQGRNVNVLVLDTEVYSNTGGQASKSTPRGATAKFATAGKITPKKNLGMMLTTYGYIYVASVDMGANMAQVVKAMLEAERFDGPSIIIAYAPCINHGYNLRFSEAQGKKAADSGYWPLFRYNPDLAKEGKNPLIWESRDPKLGFSDYIMFETRYKALKYQFPQLAEKLYAEAEEDARRRYQVFGKLAKDNGEGAAKPAAEPGAAAQPVTPAPTQPPAPAPAN